jgi:hypothetical protein
MGKLVRDFGNVYQAVKQPLSMSSRLFWALVGTKERRNLFEMVTDEEYDESERRVFDAIRPLANSKMDRPDAGLIEREIRTAADMLRHACDRGRWLRNPSANRASRLRFDLEKVIGQHRALWQARNRPGGLRDSVARLQVPLADYTSPR